MRLQKQLSKKVGSKEYDKWVVIIPPEEIKKAGWKEGLELGIEVKDGKVILKPKKSNN